MARPLLPESLFDPVSSPCPAAMHRLPYDVQLAVLRLLNTIDLLMLCATCKALRTLISDRSVWHHALLRILLLFPQPHVSRRLALMTIEELKVQVLLSARLDKKWHGTDYRPRLIRHFHCSKTVEHVNLVAGGNWFVMVLYDGSLQLHELGAPSPAVTLSHALTEDESVFYLSSCLSLTNEHEDLIVLQMGVRYNQCNIYVYHIAIVDSAPAFLLLGKYTVTGSIWCCAYGGRLLVYGLESGSGDMILHVCPAADGTGSAELGVHAPQVLMNIGPWSADEDFTVSVLSENQLMLAYHDGLSLYEIPRRSLPAERTAEDVSAVHSVRPIWKYRCAIGSGIYRISPYTWTAGPSTAHKPPAAVHPLVIAGTRALHVLRVFPDSQVDYREVPYPLALGAEIGYMGHGAAGLRRAIWDCTEARNGSARVHFRTYSLPRSILNLAEDDAEFGAGDLGVRGKLGSFSVALDPEEHLVSLCMEESSGRVCLLLNNIITGARRICVIDAV
ncbi:hypothetical protein C8Q74DRAFT_1223864 [Fomes fomentarius]|nr:hypothetical protein C8Q74DRAFT_1223864 [Fomes fomentarius]